MCIIYLALNHHPDHPLIVLANRDEFYDRPAAPARYWEDFPNIYAGRDLTGGGTWLGVTREGRFAAVTNYRDPKAPTGHISRGKLVADFLKSGGPAEEYVRRVHADSGKFSGFNLIAGEINNKKTDLFYYSNRSAHVRKLQNGIHGLSNHLLDTPWPKVRKGKALFSELLCNKIISKEDFFDLLSDETTAADKDLPDSGVSYEIEKAVSAIFIKTPVYGTRCSTVLTFDRHFEFDFEERVFV